MSDFKAQVHQIRFLLGLCPKTRLGNLQHSPSSTPSRIEGSTSKGGGKGKWGEEGFGPPKNLGVASL